MIQTDSLPSWFGVSPDVRRELDPILDAYEQAWQEHGQPDHQLFLTCCEDPQARRVLVKELKYVDQHYAMTISPVDQVQSSEQSRQQLPQKIGGYRVIGRIGTGGYGIVFLGFDSLHNRRVAIKVAHPAWLVDKDAKELASEAAILSTLDHRNIVRFLETGVEGHNEWFVVTEWIDGSTLHELLRKGLMHPRQALEIAIQIADGLQYAHEQGVAHLDVKPRNIMFDENGIVKILDFGVAKLLKDSHEDRRSEKIVGSLDYLAPEQAAGLDSQLDAQTDIYALGLVLHEMLVGRIHDAKGSEPVYRMENLLPLRSINPQIPPGIEQVCHTALQQNKNRRYATMSQMRDELKKCLNQLVDFPVRDYHAIPITTQDTTGINWRPVTLSLMLCIPIIVLLATLGLNNWRPTGNEGMATAELQSAQVPIWMKTNPPGAHIYFYPLDEQGEPIVDSEIDAGPSPVFVTLESGTYFVSAIMDDGRFSETFRSVPFENELPHAYSGHNWRPTDNGYQLPTVQIPEFDPTGMVRVGDFWIDTREVQIDDIPVNRYDQIEKRRHIGGTCVELSLDAASDYMGFIGKRLPFAEELQIAMASQLVTEDRQIYEWTRTIREDSFDRTPQGDIRSLWFEVVGSDESITATELSVNQYIGFRGLRSTGPIRELRRP